MVIANRDGNAMRLVALDRHAGSFGLSRGMTLADARARVPDIAVHEEESEADRALLSSIGDWCDRYTPAVTQEQPDGMILEISGSAHLFGGEQALLDDITRRFGHMHLASRAAIAGTADCARALARFGKPVIVMAGHEKAVTSALPVAAMELDAEQTLALRRAGLKTIADLAERPRKPFAARFGAGFLRRLSGILGEVDRPLTTRRPLPDFTCERRFAEPIGLSDDIATALQELAGELCQLLEKEGRGGRAFEAGFFRSDGVTRRLRALCARPLREPKALQKLFMTRLDGLADPLDPGFGFDAIRLSVLSGEQKKPAQIYFEAESADADAVSDLVDRLTARFGQDVVARFIPQDSYVPERAVKRLAAISGEQASCDWPLLSSGEPPLRPILLFTPPQPVETVAEVPDGPPFRFRWRRVLHEIVHREGPERIAPEWWRGTAETMSRDYYRVEDRQGYRFWLFRDGIYGRETDRATWYIHGLFA